ncbi:hypothetical protein E2C01_036747 [Portunus trituberculatus]|uniref:Uncharacterized protein n=1 Tax=Portunus trituberculatus TaxID=210409 RepID=A0A5B7F6B2_PORTR|nr:hypothetical protein [Portunus trituberculatus]
MSKTGCFGVFQHIMHQNSKCRQNTIFVELTDICKKRVVLGYFSILCTKT